jgi:hypothetical protein
MQATISDPLLQLVRDKSEPYYIKCKLSSKTHPKTYNSPYCNECGKQENGILLHYTNFISPCKCCGSSDHGLFEHIPIQENDIVSGLAQILCPSIWTTCIGKLIQEDRMSMKYRPCPEKFAEAHDYNTARAKVTLDHCYTQGSGWHMHTRQYNQLVDKVLQICYDTNNPKFKRDITHLEDTDEDIDL